MGIGLATLGWGLASLECGWRVWDVVSELGVWLASLGARAAGPPVAWSDICEPAGGLGWYLHAPLVAWCGVCGP